MLCEVVIRKKNKSNYYDVKKQIFCCGEPLQKSENDVFYICPICGQKYLVDCEGRAFFYPPQK